jgi:hypothetical protein
MSTWNYRLIEFDQSSPEERWIEIREVYYDDEGVVTAYSESAAPVAGNDPDELRAVHAMLAEAFEEPIMRESEMPQPEPDVEA